MSESASAQSRTAHTRPRGARGRHAELPWTSMTTRQTAVAREMAGTGDTRPQSLIHRRSSARGCRQTRTTTCGPRRCGPPLPVMTSLTALLQRSRQDRMDVEEGELEG